MKNHKRRLGHLSSSFSLVLATSAAICAFLATGPLIAQDAPRLEFDVALLKPTNAGAGQLMFNYRPDGLTAHGFTLEMLIGIAENLPILQSRVSGGPAWVHSERFDLDARAERPAGILQKDWEKRLRQMLANLLVERFKLDLERDAKDLPVYAITVAKGGPKLQAAKIQESDCPAGAETADSCHVINGGAGRGLHGKAVDIEDIADFVGNWTDRPVLDKTGLQGLFEIDTEGFTSMRQRMPRPGEDPSAEDLAQADPTHPTLAMVLAKLGLKLEAQRAPVETFVVKSADKPTEN